MIKRPAYRSAFLAVAMATTLITGYASSALSATEVVSGKIGENLQAQFGKRRNKTYDILVYMNEKADLTQAARLKGKAEKGRFVVNALRTTAKRTQAPVVKFLSQQNSDFQTYFVTNMIVVNHASRALINELSQMQEVGRILYNPTVRVIAPASRTQLTPDQRFAVGDNITSTGAPQLWSEFGTRGEGIVVAGQDTGIDWDHPALVHNYRGSTDAGVSHDYNWHDSIHSQIDSSSNPCGYATRAPCDDHGHGTHTLGTVAGDDGNGNQIGMAPGAKWIGCRNMDNGLGKPSTYLECFQFFLAPWAYGADPMTDGQADMAPDVINNSWGCPTSEGCNGTEFIDAIQALNAAGVMVVAAAGNDGSSCSTVKDGPATHTDDVFTVGAHDYRNNNIASFSSRGPSRFDGKISPDLTAPGVNIRSSIPGGGFSAASWSGTSMASPHVTGAVALLWAAVPELRGNIDATVAAFTSTATAKTTSQSCGGTSGQSIPNNTYGHGLMNVYNAAKTAKAMMH